jgi:hypothetical protein
LFIFDWLTLLNITFRQSSVVSQPQTGLSGLIDTTYCLEKQARRCGWARLEAVVNGNEERGTAELSQYYAKLSSSSEKGCIST